MPRAPDLLADLGLDLSGERVVVEAIEGVRLARELGPPAAVEAIPLVTQVERSPEERHADYFSKLQPLFQEIKNVAQDILLINQTNMSEANNAARSFADAAYRRAMAGVFLKRAVKAALA